MTDPVLTDPNVTDPDGGGRWAPVVYGRTRRVDRWWRAVPADVDRPWLESVVMTVVDGGRGLADGRRFLLAAGRDDICVGVACPASELSDTMHADASRRELYCFVGWTAKRTSSPSVPTLADLRSRYQDWAGPVYEHHMKRVWDRAPYELQGPDDTAPVDVRWPGTAPAEASPLRQPSTAWPIGEATTIWEAVRAASDPVAVSVGWKAASDPVINGVEGPFHVVAHGVDSPRELVVRQQPSQRREDAEPSGGEPADEDDRCIDSRPETDGTTPPRTRVGKRLSGMVPEPVKKTISWCCGQLCGHKDDSEDGTQPPVAARQAPSGPRRAYKPPIRDPADRNKWARTADDAFGGLRRPATPPHTSGPEEPDDAHVPPP